MAWTRKDLLGIAGLAPAEILEILDTAPDLADGTRELDGKSLRGEITFEHVRFEYAPDRRVPEGVRGQGLRRPDPREDRRRGTE